MVPKIAWAITEFQSWYPFPATKPKKIKKSEIFSFNSWSPKRAVWIYWLLFANSFDCQVIITENCVCVFNQLHRAQYSIVRLQRHSPKALWGTRRGLQRFYLEIYEEENRPKKKTKKKTTITTKNNRYQKPTKKRQTKKQQKKKKTKKTTKTNKWEKTKKKKLQKIAYSSLKEANMRVPNPDPVPPPSVIVSWMPWKQSHASISFRIASIINGRRALPSSWYPFPKQFPADWFEGKVVSASWPVTKHAPITKRIENNASFKFQTRSSAYVHQQSREARCRTCTVFTTYKRIWII